MKYNHDFYFENNNFKSLRGLISNEGTWLKFSNYKIESESENFFPLIVPDIYFDDIKVERYKPFDLYPTILIDFLQLLKNVRPLIEKSDLIDPRFHETPFPSFSGPIIFRKEDPIFANPDQIELLNIIAAEVLKFNNKYGLFGLYDYYTYSLKHRFDSNKNLIDSVVVFKPQYAKYGYEMNFELYINEYIAYDDYNKEQLYGVGKYNYVGDPIFTLILELYNFIKIVDIVQMYKKGNYALNDIYPLNRTINENKVQNTWADILNLVGIRNVQIGVDFSNDGNSIKWYFKSLLELMNILYIYNLTIADNEIELCEFCKGPFEKRAPNHICCTPKCNNALRQKRYQGRKKKSIELFNEGFSLDEISKQVDSSVKTIEKWLEEVD